LAEHTDTGNLIQVNSGSHKGSGFTISLLNLESYDEDPFKLTQIQSWPGSTITSND